MGETLQVLIADRRPANARGLASVVRRASEFHVHTCCHSAQEVRREVADGDVHVVVLDPELHDDDPLQAVQDVRAVAAKVAVLLTSTRASDGLFAALALGAVGCVSPYSGPPQPVVALRALVAGHPVMPLDVQAAMTSRFGRAASTQVTLTRRETEVFRLAAKGMTVPAMASALHMSPSTTKTHLQRIYSKLGARNRSAAVAIGMSSGVLNEAVK